MYLLADHIDPKGNGYIAIAHSAEKLAANIAAIGPLRERINEQWGHGKDTGPIMVGFGRWMVVYQPAVAGTGKPMMHFVDFRTDLEWLQSIKMFPMEALAGLLKLQHAYEKKSFDKGMDTVELLCVDPST